MKPLVILDRDGVINVESPDFIKTPEEWRPIPGSLEAIVRLNHAGYWVAVATNQSGVGRGLFDLAMLERIHQKMQDSLAKLGGHIDLVLFCPHLPDAHCECRKPKPKLMNDIAAHFKIDLQCTPVPAIGDSLRDLIAAQTAGCEPILVLTGNGQRTRETLPADLKQIAVYSDLAAAVDALLSKAL
ncbi:MAG TPA: D-glycero-beta-D-manno-heptose 1,7-bisphosphate 7-phosphatase [Gammaproteobacteria bacterium]|nr:D-glycero-beta-D-manno-heptose 1,7-bisphosphate 7-phosphatase [Gammaproteobacteria bacterium]